MPAMVIPDVYGLRLLRRSGVRRSIVAITVAIILVFRVIQFVVLTRQIQWGYDFSAYWAAAGRLLDGASPYTAAQLAGPYGPQQQFLYLYPPPLAAAATPLYVVFPSDYHAAAWIWAAVGFAMVVWAVLALFGCERLAETFPLLAGRGRWLLVAAAFAFPPVVAELILGNVHLLLLGLLTLAWLGSRRGTPRGELIAGAAVGIAAVIKVFPGLLLIWFVLTRRYRAAAGALLAAMVAAVISLPVTGVQPWLDYPTVLANLSAPIDSTDTLAPTVWLSDVIGFTSARILVTAAVVVLLVAVAWRARAETGAAPTSSVGSSFGAAVLLSVLVAPAMYHHYLAIAVLPFILGLAAGVRLRWLALAYFLMWGGQQAALGDQAWIINRALPTAGALVLLASLALPALAGVRTRAVPEPA
jgi:alpha-1,2-mannosyltransferase